MLVLKRVPARFYRSPIGVEPVRDWLQGLNKQDRRIIGTHIKTVEYGWPIGMPVCRPLRDGIFRNEKQPAKPDRQSSLLH